MHRPSRLAEPPHCWVLAQVVSLPTAQQIVLQVPQHFEQPPAVPAYQMGQLLVHPTTNQQQQQQQATIFFAGVNPVAAPETLLRTFACFGRVLDLSLFRPYKGCRTSKVGVFWGRRCALLALANCDCTLLTCLLYLLLTCCAGLRPGCVLPAQRGRCLLGDAPQPLRVARRAVTHDCGVFQRQQAACKAAHSGVRGRGARQPPQPRGCTCDSAVPAAGDALHAGQHAHRGARGQP